MVSSALWIFPKLPIWCLRSEHFWYVYLVSCLLSRTCATTHVLQFWFGAKSIESRLY